MLDSGSNCSLPSLERLDRSKSIVVRLHHHCIMDSIEGSIKLLLSSLETVTVFFHRRVTPPYTNQRRPTKELSFLNQFQLSVGRKCVLASDNTINGLLGILRSIVVF